MKVYEGSDLRNVALVGHRGHDGVGGGLVELQ